MAIRKDLVDHFLDAGILQFGLFGTDEAPFKLNLQLLPAYPGILEQIAAEAQTDFQDLSINRLVCAADALPFGVAASLKTGIPLVYSLGSTLPGVHDLVGAYDVGHPVLLLVNTWTANSEVTSLIDKAGTVGLKIITVLAIMDCGGKPPGDIEGRALMKLTDVVARLADEGKLPPGQGQTVIDWL